MQIDKMQEVQQMLYEYINESQNVDKQDGGKEVFNHTKNI